MSVAIQLLVVFIIVLIAIIYFVRRANKQECGCDDYNQCVQCDLYNHCKRKK